MLLHQSQLYESKEFGFGKSEYAIKIFYKRFLDDVTWAFFIPIFVSWTSSSDFKKLAWPWFSQKSWKKNTIKLLFMLQNAYKRQILGRLIHILIYFCHNIFQKWSFCIENSSSTSKTFCENSTGIFGSSASKCFGKTHIQQIQ